MFQRIIAIVVLRQKWFMSPAFQGMQRKQRSQHILLHMVIYLKQKSLKQMGKNRLWFILKMKNKLLKLLFASMQLSFKALQSAWLSQNLHLCSWGNFFFGFVFAIYHTVLDHKLLLFWIYIYEVVEKYIGFTYYEVVNCWGHVSV